MSAKHLLILSPGFPKDEDDFLCIPPLQAYLKFLSTNKPHLKISVIAFHYPAGKQYYQWHNIPIFKPNGYNESFPKSWKVKWEVWQYIQQLHKQVPIDCIHSFWLGDCAFMGDLVARKLKVKHITTLMGQDAALKNKWLHYPFHRNHQWICLSKSQQKQLLPIRKNTAVITWGILREDLPALNQAYRPIDVLGVGSLIPLKRYDLFLDVIKHLIPQFPSLTVKIIGDGLQKDQLIARCHELGLHKHVQFLGLLPRKNVLEQMNQAKVFLHTSSYESQGYVFNEALAMGMRIVSTPVGIAQESAVWKIGNHTSDLADHLASSLIHWNDGTNLVAFDMQDTVNAYLSHYGFD